MDSTRAIIRLWRLCVPTGTGPQVGGDGAIPVEVFRGVLERELDGKLGLLGCDSVDDILQSFLNPDANGVVGFLQFWRGMERILDTCGALRSRLSTPKRHAIEGFRYLRNCVLELVQKDDLTQGRSAYSVREIRYFIEKTIEIAGPEGGEYWRQQAMQLPDDSVCVDGEEVASALLAWLEELADTDEDDAQTYDAPSSTRSTNVPLTPSYDNGYDDEDSADEVGSPLRSVHLQAPSPGLLPAADLVSPAMPQGPPPNRSVQRAAANGYLAPVPAAVEPNGRVVGSDRIVAPPLPNHGWHPSGLQPSGLQPPALQPSALQPSALQQGLEILLQRPAGRPAIVTKAVAAEFREVGEFQAQLTRHLDEYSDSGRVFAFADFHTFAAQHVSASARRISEKGVTPRRRAAAYSASAPVLRTVLQTLLRKQLAVGFGCFVEARRRDRGSPLWTCTSCNFQNTVDREFCQDICQVCGVAAPPGTPSPKPRPNKECIEWPTGAPEPENDFNLFHEILRTQCYTAVLLEQRMKQAGKAGTMAWCLARLLRASLRTPWARLTATERPEPELASTSSSIPSPGSAWVDVGRPSPQPQLDVGRPSPQQAWPRKFGQVSPRLLPAAPGLGGGLQRAERGLLGGQRGILGGQPAHNAMSSPAMPSAFGHQGSDQHSHRRSAPGPLSAAPPLFLDISEGSPSSR